VSGRLSAGWAGRFAGRLAEYGFNIEKALASRNTRGFWTAGFEVTRIIGAPDGDDVDFTELLAAPGPPRHPIPIRLYGYTLSPPADARRLVLEVEAPDQIGFLSQLLNRLAFFSLFPVEMRIETTGGIVRDTVYVSSVGGGLPSADVVEALRRELDGLRVPVGVAGL
jgi:hypothetical protein